MPVGAEDNLGKNLGQGTWLRLIRKLKEGRRGRWHPRVEWPDGFLGRQDQVDAWIDLAAYALIEAKKLEE